MKNKKKDEEKITEKTKKYPITISDWITFLESESTNYISYYLSFIAIFMAITITIIELNNTLIGNTKVAIWILYLVLVFILGGFVKIIHDYYVKPYRILLKDIMYGKITKPELIKVRYDKDIKKIRYWEND